MEHPEKDIVPIIHSLTTGSPSEQQATLEKYFTSTSSFTHPFCRTGSFDSSRRLIHQIYRWYKIISPRIEIVVESVAFDHANAILYVGMRQNFRLWMVPFYVADVSITTVLSLTDDPRPRLQNGHSATAFRYNNSKDISMRASAQRRLLHTEGADAVWKELQHNATEGANGHSGKRYWIQAQNDLYQTSEFIKFVVPFGIGWRLLVLWQFFATFLCMLGALALHPFTNLLEHAFGGNAQRIRSGEFLGKD